MVEQNRNGGDDREATGLDSVSTAQPLFADIELFDRLTDSEVRELIETCRLHDYEADELLFEQGDDADSLLIIGDGTLEVVGQSAVGEKVVLAELPPGTVVGEMSLIEGGTRSATVRSLTDSRIFKLSHETFHEMRSQQKPTAYKIILGLAATVGRRRRETDERVREVFDDPASHIDSFESQLNEMLGKLRKS